MFSVFQNASNVETTHSVQMISDSVGITGTNLISNSSNTATNDNKCEATSTTQLQDESSAIFQSERKNTGINESGSTGIHNIHFQYFEKPWNLTVTYIDYLILRSK